MIRGRDLAQAEEWVISFLAARFFGLFLLGAANMFERRVAMSSL
jgi:hypothetical protein